MKEYVMSAVIDMKTWKAPEDQELLPLSVAAAVAYGHLATPPEDPSPGKYREQLDFIAAALATVIPVYGNARREDPPQLLSKSDLRRGAFRDGGQYFVCPDAPAWRGLMIPKSDFVDAIGNLILRLAGAGSAIRRTRGFRVVSNQQG
jgi:hypothetical protein